MWGSWGLHGIIMDPGEGTSVREGKEWQASWQTLWVAKEAWLRLSKPMIETTSRISCMIWWW